MGWPSPSDFVDNRAKRYGATRQAKLKTFKSEIASLQIKVDADRVPKTRKTRCSTEVESLLRSSGFQKWYEEVTCKDAAEFVSRLLDCDEWLLLGQNRDEWAFEEINNLLDAHRWQTPHYRRYWSKEIINCNDSRKRRSIILHLATPRWTNLVEVARFHKLRDEISLQTGVPHDVDHVIPLQGKMVCGLNNHFNLQIIPSSENRSKSNKYVVE